MKKLASIVYWLGESLYLNITNRCSNNCYFCLRKYKNGVDSFNLRIPNEPTSEKILAEIKEVMNKRHWKEIVFCGFGEPLERLDTVLEVTKEIKKRYTIRVRVNTNGQGQLLYKDRDVVKELAEAGVDKLSISLNAHNKETYNCVCKPYFENAFSEVLSFIEKAAKKNLKVEITVVTIPEVDIAKVREISTRIGVKFKIREYIPCFW
jgi:TatD family-associated radical SAM protein